MHKRKQMRLVNYMDKHLQSPPHVLVFPFPVQGHINCMLKLAELLCYTGLHVTFLNSDHIHERLLYCTNIHSYFSQYPNFSFQTISDGLPPDHPRTGDRVVELFNSINATTKSRFRDMLISNNNCKSNCGKPPVTCIIADGIMSFTVDVAKELHIPTILFRTISATCFWAFFCVPKLIEHGQLPLNGGSDMDRLVSNVPGLETIRMRDLPSFCRTSDLSDPGLQVVIYETQQTLRAKGLLLNTFEDLEEPALAQIRTHIPKLYTVGPLHAHLKARVLGPKHQSSSSLWEEDRSCMAWLDNQPAESVIYVSFGSMTVLTKHQLKEFWYGLVNSGKHFLWVIRPNYSADTESDDVPEELLEGTKKRGYMVGWAPQEEIVAHPAIGGFLTHSGWNSTLESVYEGVPMICWPFYADQQVNSRLVGEVWKVGLDMKDTCDRVIVEKRIKELMEVRRDEFLKSAEEMANLAKRSVEQGGSSYSNLARLIEDIKLMSYAD